MEGFTENNMEKFANGALRSAIAPRFQDISLSALVRIALAFSEGHEKYEQDLPPGYKNYKKGDTVFALAAIDHAIQHLMEFKEQCLDSLVGDDAAFDGEDHLGHLGANLVMLDFFQSKGLFGPPTNADLYEDINLTPETESILSEPEPKETLSQRVQKALGLSK